MANEISKTQIDRLGDRLKKGNITENDLRLLDEYRRSFSAAYDFVSAAIRNELNLAPTGRPAKSSTSISDKLNRETIRLSQIQDIAGCRLIVPDIATQERVIKAIIRLFEDVAVVDRRERPSFGYRAVHVVVRIGTKPVEVQVRTSLQQLWAELSEKLSDVLDPAIKYGGGEAVAQEVLKRSSAIVAKAEALESDIIEAEKLIEDVLRKGELVHNTYEALMNLQEKLAEARERQKSQREAALKTLQEFMGIFRK